MRAAPRPSHNSFAACSGLIEMLPALTRTESTLPQSSFTAGHADTLTLRTLP